MIELLPVSIGIGLVTGVIFAEFFGLAAGGMIVPGYIALHLHNPFDIVVTFLAALLTFVFIRSISAFTIMYGRRRIAITILAGYLIGAAINQLCTEQFGSLRGEDGTAYLVIGFIIPALIAIWMDRQGVVKTVCSIIIVSIAVRLILIIFFGGEYSI